MLQPVCGIRLPNVPDVVTSSVAVESPPLELAVITAELFAVTVNVLTVNVVVVAPSSTVAVDGTVATKVFLEDNCTVCPPAGAGALSVTVAVEVDPPETEVGFRTTELTVGPVFTSVPNTPISATSAHALPFTSLSACSLI